MSAYFKSTRFRTILELNDEFQQHGSHQLYGWEVELNQSRHQQAARYSKIVLEHMDSISLKHQPDPSITSIIRIYFECLFYLLNPSLIPVQMQDTITKAYGLSINLNGVSHRLTKAIQKCVTIFNRDAARKKLTTAESQGAPLIKNNSGCGSRMRIGKKDRSLRTRYHADRSSNLREETYRLRQDHCDTVQPRHLLQSPFRRRELMEIYSGEKPKHKTHKVRKNQQPQEMKDLERIKKMYQPTSSINRIEYLYEPNLLQKTQKFEFLMIPVNKSICLDDQKNDHADLNKQRRQNHSSVIEDGPSFMKKLTQAKTSIHDYRKTPIPIKKSYRIGVKTKRNTHTPTLITLSSAEDIDKSPDKDSGHVSVRKHRKHKRKQECAVI